MMTDHGQQTTDNSRRATVNGWGGILLLLLCIFPLSLSAQTGREKANAFYLEGVRQQLKGNYSEAFGLFRHALDIDPQMVGALYELSNYGHYLRNDSMATQLVERAADIDTENYWLKQSLVQLYVGQHREDDAIAQLERMAKQYPSKSEVLLMLADMYQRREDYKGVVRTLDRVELLEGKSERLSMEKFRTYVQMKDEKRAFAEMNALAEEYPNDVRYQVLIGDLLLDNDKQQQAYKVYNDIYAQHPDNINVQLSLANYYQQVDDSARCQQMLTQALLNDQLDNENRVRIMQQIVMRSVQQQSADSAQVASLLRSLLQRPQRDTQMAELAARYLIASGAPTADVKPVLLQLLSIDPEDEPARNQLLSYAVEEDDIDEVIRLSKTAVSYNSDNSLYYYYLGMGYLQQDKKEEALDAMQRGLTKLNDKSQLELIVQMYSVSGELYHQLGMDEKAYQAYDSCLLYRPDDALVLNNYAYYLSEQKLDLDRAEQMSRRSLEQEGDNPTYLDTYAWVLFQQKKYAEARVYIDSVLVLLGDSISPDDANLVEHAGDIYSRLGLTEQALDFWRQALRLDAENSALIEQKLRKKKYVEK